MAVVPGRAEQHAWSGRTGRCRLAATARCTERTSQATGNRPGTGGPKPDHVRLAGLRHARLTHDLQYDVDLFGSAGDVLAFLAKAAVASAAAGSAGLVVALGAEAVSALDAARSWLLPGTVGLIVAGGVLLVVGPARRSRRCIAGVAAGVVPGANSSTNAGSPTLSSGRRPGVPGGQLPRERIVLTNLIGQGGRAFTMPGPGRRHPGQHWGRGTRTRSNYTGHGAGTYRDPRSRAADHPRADPRLADRARDVPTRPNVHRHRKPARHPRRRHVTYTSTARPGQSWGSFNLEQQGSIVDEWYAGKTGGLAEPARPTTRRCAGRCQPYWRYIRDNIRTGIA